MLIIVSFSPCLIFMNEKSMSWILYKDWVDHYVKGHLTNSLLLPIMANPLQECSNNPPQTLLELAGFALEAASRQTAVNGRSVTLRPARVINERARWNVTKWARRLRGRTKGPPQGLSVLREEFVVDRAAYQLPTRWQSPERWRFMSTRVRFPSVNNRNRRHHECNICKARRVVLAKWALPPLMSSADYLCWPDAGADGSPARWTSA